MGFLDKNGLYYEGNRQGEDHEVPQRPRFDYTWDGKQWNAAPWSGEPILAKVREAREVVLNRLAGIGLAASAGGDSATLHACLAARTSLLNITTDAGVKAATDDASLTAALMKAYGAIVAAAPASAHKAFAEFSL